MTRNGSRILGRRRRGGAGGARLLTRDGGCGLNSVDVPALNGPSETGMSLSLTVSKDALVSDGRDFAVVTATVRGPDGRVGPDQERGFGLADEAGGFGA